MKISDFFLYLLVMAGVTYLVRAVPFILIRQKIKEAGGTAGDDGK